MAGYRRQLQKRFKAMLARARLRVPRGADPVPAGVAPDFVFAIPIAARADAEQWRHLQDMLALTLRSVFNQSDSRFRVIVAGHDRPDILADDADPRVTFLSVAFPRPLSDLHRRKDKALKRWAIAAHLRRTGGGYFMYLDGDDYVHRDLVGHVLSDDNRVGYVIERGYALDYRNRRIAPVPGVWNKTLNWVCGSTGIIYFRPSDLPKHPYPRQKMRLQRYFHIRNHAAFDRVSLGDRPNAPVPFPAAIYNVNNALNLSNVLVRTQRGRDSLVKKIDRRKITDPETLAEIRKTYGITNV